MIQKQSTIDILKFKNPIIITIQMIIKFRIINYSLDFNNLILNLSAIVFKICLIPMQIM